MTRHKHYGDWRFVRRNGLCTVQSPQGIVLAASGDVANSGIAGVDALGVPEASAPTGVREQILRFRFRSQGFFNAEPGAHFALGVTGEWRKADPNAPSWNGRLAGRGAILGNVSGAPDGCPEAPVLQLESFRRNGNRLFAGSGSLRLREGTWYELELGATLDGEIRYVLRDARGALLHQAHAADDTLDVPRGLAGWWITHVFSDANPGVDWAFDVAAIEVLWET